MLKRKLKPLPPGTVSGTVAKVEIRNGRLHYTVKLDGRTKPIQFAVPLRADQGPYSSKAHFDAMHVERMAQCLISSEVGNMRPDEFQTPEGMARTAQWAVNMARLIVQANRGD